MKPITTDILKIFKTLKPYKSKLVGGCVRDYIANNIIADDIDIATTATPDIVMEMLKKAGMHVIPTGLKHGTVTCIYNNKPYEITTLRQDIQTNGRHAKVVFTDSYYKDSLRRDFTFNALYMDADGDITDYHNGQEDLAKSIVNFIGDPSARIQEDYLRILRYFRFHGKFQKLPQFDNSVLNIIQRQADNLKQISKERITQEIFKILQQQHCLAIWNTMQKTHVLENIGLTNTPLVHFTHKEKEFEKLEPLEKLIILIPNENHIFKTFSLSNAQKKTLKKIIYATEHINLTQPILQQAYWLGYKETISTLKILNLKSPEKEISKHIQELKVKQPPTFPIKGADLIQLGYTASPSLGKVLKEVETWWVNNNFPSKDDCLTYIKNVGK